MYFTDAGGSAPTVVAGQVGSAAPNTSESIYSIRLNKSTGTATLYNGYNGTTITTPFLTTSKVSYIDFNFNDDWYNSDKTARINYITLSNQ